MNVHCSRAIPMAVPRAAHAFCKCRSIELSATEMPVATIADVLGVPTSTIVRWRNEGLTESLATLFVMSDSHWTWQGHALSTVTYDGSLAGEQGACCVCQMAGG